MAKIKSKKEVSIYLNKLLDEKGIRRAELAQKMAVLICDGEDGCVSENNTPGQIVANDSIRGLSEDELKERVAKARKVSEMTPRELENSIGELLYGDNYEKIKIEKAILKTNIFKWLDVKNPRYPGTEYLYYLSQVLSVSIEEILLCGETNQRLDTRATLFSAAKCQTSQQLEQLIALFEARGYSLDCLYDTDEHNKSIVDYMIEFENIEPLKYLIKNNLLSSETYEHLIQIDRDLAKMLKILKIIAKHDDLESWQKILEPQYQFVTKEDAAQSFVPFCRLTVDVDLLEKISRSERLLEYIRTPYKPTNEEFRKATMAYWIQRLSSKEIDFESLQRLKGQFNAMLNYLLSTDADKATSYLDVAIGHCEYILENVKPILARRLQIQRDKYNYSQILMTLPIIENMEFVLPQLRERAAYCQSLVEAALEGMH